MANKGSSLFSGDRWVQIALAVHVTCLAAGFSIEILTSKQAELLRFFLIVPALWITYLLMTRRRVEELSGWARVVKRYLFIVGASGALAGFIGSGFSFLGIESAGTFPIYIGLLLPLAMMARIHDSRS